jgi:adenosylcobinamide kinase/adenosylcobinamide-phosphate guanylyltransferase
MGCDNQLPGQVTLVLGGAASGKSRYAQRLAEAQQGALLYVATARADDDEMAQRIERHRQARGDRWQTLEVPCDLAGQLPAVSSGHAVILIDCVTLWLTNLLLANDEDPARVWSSVDSFVASLDHIEAKVIMVSNEVGLGLVPEYPLGRLFRDLAGQVNQRLAERADQVCLVTAGLPMLLKPGKF